MAYIDQGLLKRTDELVAMFDAAIAKLAPTDDPRKFFTFAHAYITKKIRKHIGLFSAPNPLMALNDSFATTFLNAMNGNPDEGWKKAFRVCEGVRKAGQDGFVGSVGIAPIGYEVCGASMANIHITQDLRNALTRIQGVDAQDYGNILIFVNEGQLFAEVQVRGRAKASLMMMGSWPVMDQLKMNAKVWRNQAYKDAYGKDVPEPAPAFVSAYRKGEGR